MLPKVGCPLPGLDLTASRLVEVNLPLPRKDVLELEGGVIKSFNMEDINEENSWDIVSLNDAKVEFNSSLLTERSFFFLMVPSKNSLQKFLP